MEDILFFKKPLDSKLQTMYTENLAYRVLKRCFPEQYKDLVQNDAPDLQIPDHSIGIEVTVAVSNKTAQIDGEFIKYRIGKESKAEKDKCICKIENCGGTIESDVLSYPVIDRKDEQSLFYSAIQNKLKKLPSYREKGFKKIGLFMLYQQPPIPPFDIEKDWFYYFDLAQEEYTDRYDFLYFCYPNGLLTYDFSSKDYKINIIDYGELSKNARIHVELQKGYETLL